MNAIAEILAHPFVYKLGWTLVHLLWQGAAVAVLLAIVLLLVRKSTANVRYLVACSALALVVVLPVVTFRLVPAPPSYASLEVESASASLMPMTSDAAKIVPFNLVLSAAAPSIGLKQRAVNLLDPALPYIVMVWVLGVFALSLWHLGGWTHLQRLRRRLTKQADASLLAKLRALAEKLKVTRPVRLLESAIVQIPTVVGWFRPVILLPATALTGLSAEQLEALLAHELAHIRRGDYLINMLQTVVEIFGFYHPAVWWISNKIRIERENCCDDIAVTACSDKMNYATALAEMERIRSTQGELALAANGGNLLMRIHRLIAKSPTPKQRFNWAAALITALVIAALAIPTTLALSRSGAFEDTPETAGERTTEFDEALPPISDTAPHRRDLRPATAGDETEDEAQILFELKLFEVRADSKLIKDVAKENGTFVRTDKAFAEQLLELTKKGKDAKLLANPRILVIEGKEGTINISGETPYIAGYAEQPDGEPKPITKFVQGGFGAKVKGELVGDNAILVRLLCEQTAPTLTTRKTADGREIQIPVVDARESDTSVLVVNDGVVIVGCFQNPDNPDYVLVVQMVSHIVGKGNGDSLTDTHSTPVVEKNDDDSDKIVLQGDILATIPQKGSDAQQDATLRASKLTLNLPGTGSLNGMPGMGIIAEGPATLTVPVQDFQAEETAEKAQVLFEFKIYDIGDDSKLVRYASKDQLRVWSGREFAEQLEALSKESKDAKVLSAPRIIVSEGEEAQMVVGAELPYIAGYTEQPGEEPKPIMKRFLDGMKLKVIARFLDNDIVRTSIIFTLTDTTFSTHKVAKDREIQIPIVAKTESSMVINLPDGATAFVGGLQSASKPERSLIMRITPHVVRPGEEPPLKGPLPVKDWEGEITFTVTPQAATSVGFGAPVERPMASDTQEIADLIRDFAAMIKGEASATFELLELQTTVKDQLDDLRRILDGREFEIANARAEGRYALLVSECIEVDGETGQLVFNLSKRGDKWVIDDIDFESPAGVKDEMKRFNDRPLKAEPVSAGIDEIVEAPMNMDPMAAETSGKIVTRVYVLQNARAGDVASALGMLVPGTGHKIVVDYASNRIVAVADESQHKQIETLILQLDVEGPDEAKQTVPHIRVFELQNADSYDLSIVLRSLLTKEQKDMSIVPDRGSNQLVIQGSEDNLEQMGKLIEVLDVARAGADTPAVETVTQVVELQYADSQQVGTMLIGLSVLGRNCRMVADERLNQLIIEAPEADLKRIKVLIDEIDKPVDQKVDTKQSIAKDKQLARLIEEREVLAAKMQSLRADIGQMQQKLGISDFGKAEDLMLQRAANIINELARTESQRMQLESQLNLLQQGKDVSISPQEQLKMRQEYVSGDATVKALAERMAGVETELLLAKQEKGGDHPEVKSKTDLLKALKERLAEAKAEVGRVFDEQMAVQAEKSRLQNIAKLKAELENNKVYEQKLRVRIDEDNKESVEMAQKQLQIQALRDELEALKAMYDEANRRITDIRMEPQPAPMLYDITEVGEEK